MTDDDFFHDPSAPPPEPERPRHYRQPIWSGPQINVIPRALDLTVVLVQTDDTAVVLSGFTAYPTGFALGLDVRIRPGAAFEELIEGPIYAYESHRRPRERPTSGLPPELLRFGIEFPDGSRATSTHVRFPNRADEPPSQPLLIGGGGGGGGNRWRYDWHVWPLPTEGTMVFVCEWPALGIPVTRAEVATAPIIQAAAEALTLWDLPPDDDGPVGWVSYAPMT